LGRVFASTRSAFAFRAIFGGVSRVTIHIVLNKIVVAAVVVVFTLFRSGRLFVLRFAFLGARRRPGSFIVIAANSYYSATLLLVLLVRAYTW
jgi:hypothetical protein